MEKTWQDHVDHVAILRGLWRRQKLLSLLIFLGLAISLLVVVYITSEALYVSSATIAIEPSTMEKIPLFRDWPRRDNATMNMVLLKSRSLSEGVVDALPKESFEELLHHSLYTDYWLLLTNKLKEWMGKQPTVFSPRQRAVAELQKARMELILSPPEIFLIKGTASSPRVAMDLVNTYIQLLLSRTRSSDEEEARKAREFLEQQLDQGKENLTQAEQVAAKYEQQKGRIMLRTQTELDLSKLSQIENAMAEAQASREVLSGRIASLRQMVEQRKSKEATGSGENQGKEKDEASAETLLRFNTFKAAQDRLARLQSKLADLQERYTEAHPLVRVTQEEAAKEQARVAQLARELPVAPPAKDSRAAPSAPSDRAEAQRQLAALQAEDADLQSKTETLRIQVDRMRKSLRNVSREEMEFSNLRRSVESNRNLVTVLSDKLMTARIREQGQSGGIVRIVDPASFPLVPSQTRTQKLMLMALALAGGIALGVGCTIEFLRQPIETDADVQKATGLLVLGSIGVIGGSTADLKGNHTAKQSTLPVYLPSSLAPAGIHIDLYRAIRATVETERLKTPFRSILVTSASPNEGKSTTVANLAHVFQEFGQRVLMVEADLRRPMLSRALSVANKPGLVDYLTGSATFDQICRVLPSGVTVIPSQVARGDVAAMLASVRASALLQEAYAHFDLVLVDSAPVLAVPDNLLLVTKLDRVILVVKASATAKRDLCKAQSALQQANARILGVILNQANPRDVHYYSPRYRKYYRPSNGKTEVSR